MLNEIINEDSNEINDQDYLNGFMEITSYVLRNDKSSKLYKKVQSLRR